MESNSRLESETQRAGDCWGVRRAGLCERHVAALTLPVIVQNFNVHANGRTHFSGSQCAALNGIRLAHTIALERERDAATERAIRLPVAQSDCRSGNSYPLPLLHRALTPPLASTRTVATFSCVLRIVCVRQFEALVELFSKCRTVHHPLHLRCIPID